MGLAGCGLLLFLFLSEDLALSIRYPLAVELGVGLSGGGPWVLLELGFFFLSEDLMLSILYPLAVEQVGMSGGGSAGANLTGIEERARRGLSMVVGQVGEGVGGRQIRGGDGERDVEGKTQEPEDLASKFEHKT